MKKVKKSTPARPVVPPTGIHLVSEKADALAAVFMEAHDLMEQLHRYNLFPETRETADNLERAISRYKAAK